MKIKQLLNNYLFSLEVSPKVIERYQKIIVIFSLINFLSVYFNFNDLLTDRVVALELNQASNRFIISLTDVLNIEKYGIPSQYIVSFFVALYFICLVSFLLNFARFYASILIWLLHLSFVESTLLFSYGADYILSFLLFYNCLLSCSRFVSTKNVSEFYSFSIRFLQMQLFIIYFFAGFGKILGIDWISGEAVYYIFMSNNINVENHIVFKIMTWYILALEILYPFLMSIPKTRIFFLLSIIGLHIGIAIFMKLYTFSGLMIMLNVFAFAYDGSLIPKAIRNTTKKPQASLN